MSERDVLRFAQDDTRVFDAPPGRSQREQREHAPGATFLRAIRIVALKITRGADAAVVNFTNAGVATLLQNLRGEIDFIVRRANAWTELHHEIRPVHAEIRAQQFDCVADNAKGAAFLARVHETDGASLAIDEINSAAIRHINSETNIVLVGDQTVTILNAAITRPGRIDDGNLVSMHLPRRDEGATGQCKLVSRPVMSFVQVREHGRFVVRECDSWNPPHEAVRYIELLERRKLLERKIAIFQPNDR